MMFKHEEMSAKRTRESRRARRVSLLAGAVMLGSSLAAGVAHAVVGDRLLIDPQTMPQAISYNWASNPSSAPTQFNLTFSPTTRSAYTQAAPLDLPCDVNWLATGMSFRNVGSQGLYVEMGGSVYVNGNERQPIANVYSQTEAFAPLAPELLPNNVGTGGFIFIAQPPLYNYLPSQFPANVPLKIRMIVRPFSSTAYDTTRGGYFLSSQIPENPIYNNTWFLWVRRTCP